MGDGGRRVREWYEWQTGIPSTHMFWENVGSLFSARTPVKKFLFTKKKKIIILHLLSSKSPQQTRISAEDTQNTEIRVISQKFLESRGEDKALRKSLRKVCSDLCTDAFVEPEDDNVHIPFPARLPSLQYKVAFLSGSLPVL